MIDATSNNAALVIIFDQILISLSFGRYFLDYSFDTFSVTGIHVKSSFINEVCQYQPKAFISDENLIRRGPNHHR